MPKTVATAAVDRILHSAHVVITEGTSLRLAEAIAGRGGPLELSLDPPIGSVGEIGV